MKNSILPTFVFLLLSFVLMKTFGQEINENRYKKDSNSKTGTVKNPNDVQTGGDKIIFKDGTTQLLEIENTDFAGAINIFESSGSGVKKALHNNGGILTWGADAIGLASGGVSSIGDLSDAFTNASSIYLGVSSLPGLTTGVNNNSLGIDALKLNTIGSSNNAIGISALGLNTEGGGNEAMGNSALYRNTTGSGNIGIGNSANYNNKAGSNNTIIGYRAGYGTQLHDKSGNVFLGYNAGYNEEGSNKLYIENSNSATPLIYGDFTDGSEMVKINGDLHVKNTSEIIKMESSTDNGWLSLYNNPGTGAQYIGYVGTFNGTIDIDVGTGVGNTTGNLNLVTNATPRVIVSSSGDVDVKSGELNRSTKTGAANLLPIAYGNIAADGTINSGTGNFTVTWTAGNNYNISIPGESLNYPDYIYIITGNIFYNFGTTFNGDGTVFINTLELSSGNQGNQAFFSLVIYKP